MHVLTYIPNIEPKCVCVQVRGYTQNRHTKPLHTGGHPAHILSELVKTSTRDNAPTNQLVAAGAQQVYKPDADSRSRRL